MPSPPHQRGDSVLWDLFSVPEDIQALPNIASEDTVQDKGSPIEVEEMPGLEPRVLVPGILTNEPEIRNNEPSILAGTIHVASTATLPARRTPLSRLIGLMDHSGGSSHSSLISRSRRPSIAPSSSYFTYPNINHPTTTDGFKRPYFEDVDEDEDKEAGTGGSSRASVDEGDQPAKKKMRTDTDDDGLVKRTSVDDTNNLIDAAPKRSGVVHSPATCPILHLPIDQCSVSSSGHPQSEAGGEAQQSSSSSIKESSSHEILRRDHNALTRDPILAVLGPVADPVTGNSGDSTKPFSQPRDLSCPAPPVPGHSAEAEKTVREVLACIHREIVLIQSQIDKVIQSETSFYLKLHQLISHNSIGRNQWVVEIQHLLNKVTQLRHECEGKVLRLD